MAINFALQKSLLVRGRVDDHKGMEGSGDLWEIIPKVISLFRTISAPGRGMEKAALQMKIGEASPSNMEQLEGG